LDAGWPLEDVVAVVAAVLIRSHAVYNTSGLEVLNIDTKNMVVTMVSHRGWGPDGRTVYYIVTDATPKMPADMMGVAHVPAEEKLASTLVTVDLFQFMNEIMVLAQWDSRLAQVQQIQMMQATVQSGEFHSLNGKTRLRPGFWKLLTILLQWHKRE
jgi:hypothetical protein